MADRPTTLSTSTRTKEVPAVWGNVPQRNKNFTGREELLTDLRRRVTTDVTAVLAHALHGMGGVGKTQLTVEYAYRYMGDYDVIWWIPADQIPIARSALAGLAPRLGLEDIPATRVEDRIVAVFDALRRGEPYKRWLLIFDNADQPEEILDILDLLPAGSGHIIVTSRNHRWQSVADAVEVDVFSREESLAFLNRRVEGIATEDAIRLAEELGDLPLALEQAGALQVESAMTVSQYLDLLAEESAKVLGESRPTDYPVGVAAAWSLSMQRLESETPFAWELLRRMAFFGPEPIELELLRYGRFVLDPPLQDQLQDPMELNRATRELGRYALARVDNIHQTLQVHRLIQKLIRDGIDPETAESMRHEVHLLLAAADPGLPDEQRNWERYAALLAHVVPSKAVQSPDPKGRRLVRNVIRYVTMVGDLETSKELSTAALERWTEDSGRDDPDVLILSGQRANLHWHEGQYEQAYNLRRDTLRRMADVFGEENDETLLVTNDHGADLRARGEFKEALDLDEDTLAKHKRVFGEDHPQTFMVANNLAVDQGLNSQYAEAEATNRKTHQDRLDTFQRDDDMWVISSLAAIGRDIRQGGKYVEALEIQEQAYEKFGTLVRRRLLAAHHPWVLWQAKDLSIARRKMGQLEKALELAEEVVQKYVAAFGSTNPDTLAAVMNLCNARRVYGDVNEEPDLLARADAELDAAYADYRKAYGERHPYTRGCALNLAIVRRRVGDASAARGILQEALIGFRETLGDGHHFTLTCMTELATSLSTTEDVDEAIVTGRAALAGLKGLLGDDHPHTLACASNLAIDLRKSGHADEGVSLLSDTLDRYRAILPDEHVDVMDAASGKRIALDIEPTAL